MTTAGVPHPYTAPANPVTFNKKVPTVDPLGFIRADNGNASPLAISAVSLYNHRGGRNDNGFVHSGLSAMLRGGSFGEGVAHAQYDFSSTVTLDETTPVDVKAFAPRIILGSCNSHHGYLSRYNDLSILFPVVLFSNHRQRFIMQEKIYNEKVLPQATPRSLVPSLRHSERSCEFYLQEIGGGIDIAIESLIHGNQELVNQDILRRIAHLEKSFAKTINVHMTNALATAPSVTCRWLMRQWNDASEVIKGTHPNPARWVNQVLTNQLTSFCPSQLRNVSKRHPIRDLLKSLAFTSAEDEQRTIFLVTTATVAEMLMENNETVSLPEAQRVFYFQEDGNLKSSAFRPLQTFPGLGVREAAILPVVQVDGQKLPILKIPDVPDKDGTNTSSFVNYITGMFAVPIGYTLRHLPEVSTFRQVNFNAVRMTAFDLGGEDGEMQWHRDILCRSGLNDPALFDPHEYDKAMLIVDGGEAAAKAFKDCFRGQDKYDERVFSSTGITPRDPEFNLCVSNHVLYVGKSFGRTIPKDSMFPGIDPNSVFRLTGIDGNQPLVNAKRLIQTSRTAIANLHDMNRDHENVFKPYLEACLRIPFDLSQHPIKTGGEEIFDRHILQWLTTVPNVSTFVLSELQKTDESIHPNLLCILKSVFHGSGISKWMNVPRVLFAILEAANLGAFTPRLHTVLVKEFTIGEFVERPKYQDVVECLRDVYSAMDSFYRDTMASFAVDDTNVRAYIFEELPTVVPVVNIPNGTSTPINCDNELSQVQLVKYRMLLETVFNMMATHMYALTDLPDEDLPWFTEYNYVFQVQVHNKQKRHEVYKQPYFVGGFYTTHEYDVQTRNELRLRDVTDYHPLLSARVSTEAGPSRRNNFYHSHVSRHFADLRRMYGIPLSERVVATLACLRPHTPANALTVPPRVQTHAAAHIIRYGTFETHRLVAVRSGEDENMFNGFSACATPVLRHKRSSNGGTALGVFMQTAPVLPNKSNTTIQVPHFFCRGNKRGMGHRMANIQDCLDGKVRLSPSVFEDEAFAVPVPSYFADNEFGVPFFPIDGVHGPSFLQDTVRCDRIDPLHTMEGARSYNPMARTQAPSEIVVLNRRLISATGGRVQLPPWSTANFPSNKRTGLQQRLAKLGIAAVEGMKPDAQWAAGTEDSYLNITPEDRICMFERYYHPGPKGHEYGQKSRSILGENSNSSLNWTQTLETHHRMFNQAIKPLNQSGCEQLINDRPAWNGFGY